MKKDTRYIYKVIYSKEGRNSNNEVITDVCYWRWDRDENKFIARKDNVHSFAEALTNNRFKARAGKDCEESPDNCKEVIGYENEYGKYWIKTTPDGREDNNLSFLNFCNSIKIASHK